MTMPFFKTIKLCSTVTSTGYNETFITASKKTTTGKLENSSILSLIQGLAHPFWNQVFRVGQLAFTTRRRASWASSTPAADDAPLRPCGCPWSPAAPPRCPSPVRAAPPPRSPRPPARHSSHTWTAGSPATAAAQRSVNGGQRRATATHVYDHSRTHEPPPIIR